MLLPEVATDQGWSREQLLAGVCRKARLPPDAYLDPRAELRVFETLKFS